MREFLEQLHFSHCLGGGKLLVHLQDHNLVGWNVPYLVVQRREGEKE